MKRPRIILADQDRVLMDGIRSLLELTYDVVGTFNDGIALVDAARTLVPDVVILDTEISKMNGLSACVRIKGLSQNTKIIFLTINNDLATAGEAFRVGASGYVLKTSRADELLAAISKVLKGGYFATPCLTKGIRGSFVQNLKSIKPSLHITNRQKEVLHLLAEGCSMRQIGNILNISARTVAFHKYSMMQRLGIQTTAQLLSHTTRSRLSSSPIRRRSNDRSARQSISAEQWYRKVNLN